MEKHKMQIIFFLNKYNIILNFKNKAFLEGHCPQDMAIKRS